MARGVPLSVLDRLGRSRLARSIGVLASGTVLGQLAIVATSPVLSRLYEPADFGVLTVFNSALSIATVVACLGYEHAVVLPTDEDERAAVAAVAGAVAVAFSAMVTLVLITFGAELSQLAGAPSLIPHLWLLPVTLIAATGYRILNQWVLRRGAYGRVARTDVARGVGQSLCQVLLGVAGARPFGLLAGAAVGRSAGTFSLWLEVRPAARESFSRLRLQSLRRVAYRYRRFPLFTTWAALFNSSGLYVPPVLIASQYGAQVAGWFALADRVVAAPMTLLGRAVARAFVGEASARISTRPDRVLRDFRRIVASLAALGAAPLLVLILAGPSLFAWVFGENWTSAGRFAAILAPMFWTQFITVPLSQTLNLLERQNIQLAWDVLRFLLVVGGLLLSGQQNVSDTTAIVVYSATMGGAYLVLLGISYAALRRAAVAVNGANER